MLYDSDYVYYLTKGLSINNSLTPYFSGLQLVSSSSLVGAVTNYTLTGVLSDTLMNMRIIFNGSNPITLSQNNTNLNINIQLGQFSNPSSIYWNVSNSVKIYNDTFVLYSNMYVPTTTLQAYSLSTIADIVYNPIMRVNSTDSITILFNNVTVNSKVIIILPVFFKSILQCMINNISVVMSSVSSSQFMVNSSSNSSTSMYMIQINLNNISFANNVSASSTPIRNITLRFVTNDYQLIVANKIIKIQT